jgi:hypothetical protein
MSAVRGPLESVLCGAPGLRHSRQPLLPEPQAEEVPPKVPDDQNTRLEREGVQGKSGSESQTDLATFSGSADERAAKRRTNKHACQKHTRKDKAW